VAFFAAPPTPPRPAEATLEGFMAPMIRRRLSARESGNSAPFSDRAWRNAVGSGNSSARWIMNSASVRSLRPRWLSSSVQTLDTRESRWSSSMLLLTIALPLSSILATATTFNTLDVLPCLLCPAQAIYGTPTSCTGCPRPLQFVPITSFPVSRVC
ncbi:unnamed protein product, partial [Ectocarpus sp. 12 AP-2014]